MYNSNGDWYSRVGAIIGVVVGGIAGGLVGTTAGVIAAYGASSVAGTAMITGTATIAARATEVGVLQYKKSIIDGKSGWQVANDILYSTYNNTSRILSPVGMKTVTTTNAYISYYKINPVGFKEFARSSGNKLLSYAFAAYAWCNVYVSFVVEDPVPRASQRGYSLI